MAGTGVGAKGVGAVTSHAESGVESFPPKLLACRANAAAGVGVVVFLTPDLWVSFDDSLAKRTDAGFPRTCAPPAAVLLLVIVMTGIA